MAGRRRLLVVAEPHAATLTGPPLAVPDRLLSAAADCPPAADGDRVAQCTHPGRSDDQASWRGWFNIKNVHSGLCLNIAGNSALNGADLIQYKCTSDPNDRFTNPPA